ncbi:MAG: FecR family protein [Bacteroidota bacterium]
MKITSELLDKYGKGLCTKEERNAIATWMETYGGLETLSDEILEDSEEAELEIVEERLWNTIKKTKKSYPRISNRSTFKPKIFALAATVALLIGLMGFFLVNNTDVYRSGFGEIKTIRLSDGTEIMLNSGSELIVPNNFWKKSRAVTLKGEAYFDVTKNPELPFVVTTDKSVIKVLGTKFNLNAYQGEMTTVHLDEGRIAFKNLLDKSAEVSVLLPGEQAAIIEGAIKKESTSGIDHIAWMEKKLVFTGKPFKSVTKTLERHYGFEFIIRKDGLATRKYNGSHSNQPLQQLLEDISFVMKFKYEIQGNTIIIY